MEIDNKKIRGSSPKDVFEAIDKMNKAHNELTEAIFIMKSIIDNLDDKMIDETNIKRVKLFLTKFSKE